MKNQVWHIVRIQCILRLSLRRVQHLPRAPILPGNPRRQLENGESSREALLGEAEEAAGSGDRRTVPKGHLAVYVGPELRRFVIPASCLAMPEFKMLMDRVAEEFGFEHQGGLHIPCDEAHFEEILNQCLEIKSRKKRL